MPPLTPCSAETRTPPIWRRASVERLHTLAPVEVSMRRAETSPFISARTPPSSFVRSVSFTSTMGSVYASSPMNTAARPCFSPIFFSVRGSNCREPTEASSVSRSPSSMKRVPGCAAWTCSTSWRAARSPSARSGAEVKSTMPSVG